MRLALFVLLFSVCAVTGCYNPHVQSGGFACAATDNPPCPSGFFCVSGLCVDHPSGGGGGGAATGDMAMSTATDMSMAAGGDLAGVPADMTQLATDMSCLPFGYGCNYDTTCCSQCCAGGCTLLGYCALP